MVPAEDQSSKMGIVYSDRIVMDIIAVLIARGPTSE